MSKRAHMRVRQRQRHRRRRMATVVAVAAVAVAVAVVVIREISKPVGEIVSVPVAVRSYADGKALGPIDAPVLIQEFSNFT